MIEIVDVGRLALVQDLGRPGLAHLGVAPSGAADRASLVAANRRVGNPDGAAALEVIGSLTVRVTGPTRVALAGAPAPLSVDGVDVEAPVELAAGARLTLGDPPLGLRTYLAVAGGIEVPLALGSRATDVMSGLGPAPVRAGDRLPLGSDPAPGRSGAAPPLPAHGALVMLDAASGPRPDWLADADALYARPWRVSELADRVGVRLIGEPLQRRRTEELPSEGVVTGSVQVPPGGEPVVLGPDHPVTGGYPVVAVLTAAACDTLAQLRAGTTVRFRRAR